MASPATAADGTKKLRLKSVTRKIIAGLDVKFQRTDEADVYNEYDDAPSQVSPGEDFNNGDQILADEGALQSFVVEAYDATGSADVITYDLTTTGDYVEVDMTYFESFEEYYDEVDEEPVYEVSDCGSGIGIRG